MIRSSGRYSRVARIALLLLLCAAAAYADADSPADSSSSNDSATAPALQVIVEGLRNDKGHLTCSLFNDPKQYPRGQEFREVRASIHGDAGICVFKDLPAGKYAVVVYHDENGNGHFDQNAFGMPLEGYGFSKNAAPLFDAPSFAAAGFDYDGQYFLDIIRIRY